MSVYKDIKGIFTHMSKNEIALLILTLSVFFTVYAEAAVLLTLPVYILITKQGFIFRRRKSDVIFLGIFWALSMAVTIIYGGRMTDILMGIFMIFAFIAMIFICYAMTQRMFRIILSLCCLMSPLCFAVALIQRFMGLTWSYGARYSSVFLNPNYYAFYISLVILFCIYNIIKEKNRIIQIGFAALIPLNLAALYMTECRTTFIVLLAVCPIMLWFSGKKKLTYIYLGILAAFTILAFIFEDNIELLPRIRSVGEDFAKRMDIWRGAIKSIKDAPFFGRGYNTYIRIYDLYDSYDAAHSHNLLLEMLMDFGIIGAGALVGYFGINIGKIIRLHRKNICHHRFALTAAVIACVLLHGLFDITMLWPQTSILVMYVLGYSTDYDKVHIFTTERSHSIISVNRNREK